jgi:hypothetical protein
MDGTQRSGHPIVCQPRSGEMSDLSSYMSWRDAAELCELRIKEDRISASLALREFRQLTGWGLRDAEPIYRQFQKLEHGAGND